MSRVLLLTPVEGDLLERLKAALRPAEVSVARDPAELLQQATADPDAVLIGYGTGVIVPPAVLAARRSPAYNFHGASPEYPGRDPHHFAVYDGASRYGATAHGMVARVDAGPIVGVERFDVPPGVTPDALLGMANAAMLALFERLAPAMASGRPLPELAEERWAGRRSTRHDLLVASQLSPLVDAVEFDRRMHAFQSERHRNLTTVLHGHVFRVDPEATPIGDTRTDYAEFTESGYRALVRLALAGGYRFVTCGEAMPAGSVFWRHDIDLSVHRALRIAEIECEEGVRSTFLVNPHSAFYNVFEAPVAERLRRIAGMGHRLGLHFDGEAGALPDGSRGALEARISAARRLVEEAVGQPVDVVSWHNPEVGNLLGIGDDRVAGMVNCYGDTLRKSSTYVSDSNGYWRFKPAAEVIREAPPRLHVLTHPGWWTPDPMPPRQRVERCLLGRARAVMAEYDAFLAAQGRRNLGR